MKNTIFITVLTFLIFDSILGLWIFFIEKPIEFEVVKTLHKSNKVVSQPHPYLSYQNGPPGIFYHWTKGSEESIFRHSGYDFDYGFLDEGEGLYLNENGHQIEPTDIKYIENTSGIKNNTKILFLGGSTTFQPWPHLTANVLNQSKQHKSRVIAINAGTGGYTSQENLIDLAIRGLNYKPNIVVAYLPINDIYWSAHTPDFKRDYTHMRIPLKISVLDSKKSAPIFNLSTYPFSLKYIDWFNYRNDFQEYTKGVSLTYASTKTDSNSGKLIMDPISYSGTVQAIIENIRSMNALAKSIDSKFILITQKTFQTNNPYYTFMDRYVTEANQQIIEFCEKNNIAFLDMDKKFPMTINKELKDRAHKNWPNMSFNSGNLFAYDSMHFTPIGLALFSLTTADFLSPFIEKLPINHVNIEGK